jgi:alpha-tubulin suppressor-like RCC1 family protein
MRSSMRLSRKWMWLSVIAVAMISAAAPAIGYAETGSSAVGWGKNAGYQLGAGFKTEHGIDGEASPVTVAGLDDITEITSGDDWTLARLSDGTVRAWGGSNTFGELGDGTRSSTREEGADTEEDEEEGEEQRSTVSGLSDVRQIAVGGSNGMALLDDGEVVAWGSNWFGELGDGLEGSETHQKEEATEKDVPFLSQLEPQHVAGLSNVVAIAAGNASDYALEENGTLWAWGKNEQGQLGIGEEELVKRGEPELCVNPEGNLPCSTVPREVELPAELAEKDVKVTAVSAGSVAAYALLSNGHALAWGNASKGKLGIGSSSGVFYTPQEVKDLSEAVTISGGEEDALALLSDGEVVGWGISAGGQLGTSTEAAEKEECSGVACHKVPQPINDLKHIVAVSDGPDYGLVLNEEGKVYAFGDNLWGRLGIGSTTERTDVPTLVEGIGAVSRIAATAKRGLAVLRGGVTPPSPLVSIHPGAHSMELTWRFGEQKWEVSEVVIHYHPLDDEKDKSAKFEFSGPGSHLFKELNVEPYVFNLRDGGDGSIERAIVGTPES